jgi:hypothetical protein
MRALLDRDGPLYHAVYNQRTACERINSQAQALGIERPKVRNINTLIYRYCLGLRDCSDIPFSDKLWP